MKAIPVEIEDGDGEAKEGDTIGSYILQSEHRIVDIKRQKV
jgi:hypothetical protein